MADVAQGRRQQSLRTVTGKAYDHNGDWIAKFQAASIASSDFNGMMIAWINAKLVTTYTTLNGAQAALAAANSANTFTGMGTFNCT